MNAAQGLDIGTSLVAPTLQAWGTEEQQSRYLPNIEQRREQWCQLFSEPGAGSDLASLSTRAERDGDRWRVNGQKVWSTLAHVADYGILLARTGTAEARHAGITCFAIDMRQTGVTVRPLRQMTGDADEFNEVFLDDAHVADSDRIGAEGAGWQVAKTVLTSERAMLGGLPRVGGGRAEQLIAFACEDGAWHDPRIRDSLTALLVAERVLQLTNLRVALERQAGHRPAAATTVKLARSTLVRRLEAMSMSLRGPAALAWDDTNHAGVGPAARFLHTPCETIIGGTSEIQRNIIAERVLGLPREPRGRTA